MATLTGGGVPSSAVGAGVSAGFCSSATAPSPSNGEKQQEGQGGDEAPASRCVSRGPVDRARGAIIHAMRWFDQSVLFRETTRRKSRARGFTRRFKLRGRWRWEASRSGAARVSRVRRQMAALAGNFSRSGLLTLPGRGGSRVRGSRHARLTMISANCIRLISLKDGPLLFCSPLSSG